MNVGLYAIRIQSRVMNARAGIERAYDDYADPSFYWCFIDLKDSSNYRIRRGSRDGYVRGETFFTLIDSVISHCEDVRLLKEIGDGVFLSSGDIRQILESMVLIHAVADQIARLAGTEEFPFGIRAALGYGNAKKLTRKSDDFLGTSIDQLARIASRREADLLVDDAAYSPNANIFREYESFLTVSEPKMLTKEQSKDMLKPVYYRTLEIDRQTLVEFPRFFTSWRKQGDQIAGDAS